MGRPESKDERARLVPLLRPVSRGARVPDRSIRARFTREIDDSTRRGAPDFYPFMPCVPAVRKLRFTDKVARNAAGGLARGGSPTGAGGVAAGDGSSTGTGGGDVGGAGASAGGNPVSGGTGTLPARRPTDATDDALIA